MNFLNLPGI